MKKPRYAIKHNPTGKFLYEDEGGVFLVPEEESFLTYGNRRSAEEQFSLMFDQTVYACVCPQEEDGEFPKTEFEITEV